MPKGNQNAQQKEASKKEEVRDVVTLEFDDGKEQACFIEGIFDCGGQDYIALVPDDKSGDVYIYKYFQIDDENYRLEDEADEAKFAAAVREYEDIVGYKREA
ncbi:MAG: DUF1292 domain-containing protein [Clostridiales bacterium]|nr:DUF1292 domain-containing protein [Clostridiales bacterium]